MYKALAQIDPKAQLGIAAGGLLLAFVAGIYGVGILPTGPWWAALVLCVIASALATFGLGAWPKKLPEGVSLLKEKWEKSRGRATKTPAGKFFWGAGRSIIAAVVGSMFIPLQMDGGFMKLALLLGFGASTGFFGIRAAAWSGTFIFLAGHQVGLNGLGVDFADPASREALWISWSQGQAMSWWWPIGFVAAPFAWIGIAAASVAIGAQMTEKMKEREAARIAKEKIDARRRRLRDRRDDQSVDPVEEARKAAERALAKAGSVATGDPGKVKPMAPTQSPVDAGASATQELGGVENIQRRISETKLEGFAQNAKSLLQSKDAGLDTNTAARRSFDRVVAALTDAELEILRGVSWGADLLTYYNHLHNIEDAAMRGGEGHVVTSSYVDELEDETFSRAGEPLQLLNEPVSDAVMAKDILDQDDEVEEAASTATSADDDNSFHAISAKRENTMKGLATMLSQSVTDATKPETTQPVGMAPGNIEMSSEDILSVPETVVDEAAANDDQQIVGQEDATAGSDLADHDAVDNDGDAAAEDVIAEAADQDVDGREDEAPVAEETVLAGEDAAAAPLGEGAQVAVGSVEWKEKAGVILTGNFDQAFVRATVGLFESADQIASDIGIPASIFASNYDRYAGLEVFGKAEKALENGMASGDGDAVLASIQLLKGAGDAWLCADLIERGEGWVAERENENAAEIERARIAEEERVREEEARQAEAERVAEEERAKREEEEAQRLEAERIAREEAAEAERTAALERRRHKVASWITMNKLTDEVLVDGAELFPSVESLAETLEVEQEDVEEAFNRFALKVRGKHLYDQIASAMTDESNAGAVEDLLRDTAALESYQHPVLNVENIRSWICGVETRQRALGLVDRGAEVANAGDPSLAARALIKKKTKAPAELIEIIETSLPAAVKKANALAAALEAIGGNDPGMQEHLARSLREVAEAASKLVEQESACREYANIFLPRAAYTGNDPWAAIVEMAAPAAAAEMAPLAAEVAPTPTLAETGGKVIDYRRSLEQVQALDIREQVGLMELGTKFDWGEIERKLRMSFTYVMPKGLDADTLEEPRKACKVYMHDDDGKRIGAIFVEALLDKTPLWYDHSKAHIVTYSEAGGLKSTPEKELRDKVDLLMVDDFSDVPTKAMILIAPHLTDDAITSFRPWIEKFQKGPVVITNHELQSLDLSAFVKGLAEA